MNSLPALFLLFAAVLGGLRSWEAMAMFEAAFFICLAFFDKEFSASGMGAWGLLALWLAAGLAFSPAHNSIIGLSEFLFDSLRGLF